MSDAQSPVPAISTRYDVVIVGAGPAGSALAIWLATEGWRVLLVERERLPHHKVCGEFLSPEAQSTLAALGVEQSITALAPVHLNGAQVTTASGRTLDLKLSGQAWGISRYTLDAALAAAAEARGAEVWTETTVTRCIEVKGETAGGQRVQLRRRHRAANTQAANTQDDSRGSDIVESRAVVLACGRHGAPLPGSQNRGRRAGNSSVGIKCHFAHITMPKQVELYLFAGGYVGINPVENGAANVCALASYDTFARGGRSPRGLIDAVAEWNPAFGERLCKAYALPETECAVAPVNTWRRPSPWTQVPCIGDSAAMIPPLCGDGMAMALRSAELCGPLLSGYLHNRYSWREVGEQYSRVWHREFSRRLHIGRWLESMLLFAPTADLLARVGGAVPALANYLVQATRGANH
jgi:flavin-dependent dehydrogenase